jgi:hypothetical protein
MTIRLKPNLFHAVEIRCTVNGCLAAQGLGGIRFLSRANPPQLPLSGCTQPNQCTCRYLHHEDRRQGARRESDPGNSGIHRIPPINRRTGRGRRADD